MRSAKWREDTEMARRMRAAGVPLELDEDKREITPPANGLSIERNAEGIAEAIGETSTGYILDVYIVPNVPWPFEIARATLQLPWDDPNFQWIRDPRENGAQYEVYSLPGTSLYYPRDEVINHFWVAAMHFRKAVRYRESFSGRGRRCRRGFCMATRFQPSCTSSTNSDENILLEYLFGPTV